MNVSLHHLSYSVRLFLLEWRARQVKPHRVGDGGDLLIVGAISDCDGERPWSKLWAYSHPYVKLRHPWAPIWLENMVSMREVFLPFMFCDIPPRWKVRGTGKLLL